MWSNRHPFGWWVRSPGTKWVRSPAVKAFPLRMVVVALLAAIGLTHPANGAFRVPGSADGRVTAGVAWLSGASTTSVHGFDSWLGRDIDLDSLWTGRESWSTLTNISWLPTRAQFPGQLSIGIAMLPDESDATLQQCATGAYDTYYAQMGQQLSQIGRGNAYLRLGWEMNTASYRWANAWTDPGTWVSCWRHEVAALRSTDPAAQIVWNPNSTSTSEVVGKALSYYPGDAWVDVVGVDYYDAWPALNTREAWDANFNRSEPDGMPVGLGAYLNFAKEHGKKLAVPEWGTSTGDGTGGDDPFYIEQMHNFFAQHASDVAYEAYFDEWQQFSLSGLEGPSQLPAAAAEYRKLFSTS